MTEAELIAEIALVQTAISNVARTGERYVIGTGPSRREFENDLGHLRLYLAELKRDLKAAQYDDGVMVGF